MANVPGKFSFIFRYRKHAYYYILICFTWECTFYIIFIVIAIISFHSYGINLCTVINFLFILQGIENYCKVENGYTSIGNVRSTIDTKPKDKMESFFLGETLKYLYLLFMEDQSAFSVDKWVFNSEAHPLPIYTH